jgi:hypothetical protein
MCRQMALERDHWRCQACGSLSGLEVDHIETREQVALIVRKSGSRSVGTGTGNSIRQKTRELNVESASTTTGIAISTHQVGQESRQQGPAPSHLSGSATCAVRRGAGSSLGSGVFFGMGSSTGGSRPDATWTRLESVVPSPVRRVLSLDAI